MSDICKMRIKIADNPTYGIDYYGFYLAKSQSEMGCDPKDSSIVITDFPEVDGDTFYIPPMPSRKSFDYDISLSFFDDNLNSANKKISEFYNSLFGQPITIYNDYKGVKLVGRIKSYKAGEFYRNEKDVVLFDLTFYIPRPQDCDFNYSATKIYYGVNYDNSSPLNFSSQIAPPIDIVIPAGTTNVMFAWDSSLGNPTSVMYNELGYNVKDIFSTSQIALTVDGVETEYTLFLYTPAIPFSKQVTYSIK